MLKGVQGQNGSFLSDLTKIENRISTANRQITSGIRVSQASDDPTAIAAILRYQGQIDQLDQTQTNLALAKTEVTTADSALQAAGTILDQLTSIATQGASGTSSADTRTTLGEQVKQLAQQLVSIANTSINGRFLFGGDDVNVSPYTFDWSAPGGVVRNSTASTTRLLQDGNGSSISPGMTAAEIFDANLGASPSSTNIFQAVYALGQALASNDISGIQAAATSLKDGTAHLTQVSASYGNTENWIAQATDAATSQLANLQQLLASVRETDLPSAITQLTSDQTALQAAISAHASLSSKSLFDYLG